LNATDSHLNRSRFSGLRPRYLRPGFDGYFRELIAAAAGNPEWPPADPTPWIELGKRYDTYG